MNIDPIKISDELLVEMQPRLYAYILGIVLDPENAKDILQDTNRTVLEKSDAYSPGTNFNAWAYKIAQNKCRSFIEKNRRRKLELNNDYLDKIADEWSQIDLKLEQYVEHLQICLKRLQPKTSSIVADYYYEKKTAKEIASERKLKANHVAQILYRARSILLKCIQQQYAG